MKREIIVANDFYADPDAIVQYALSQKYYSPFSIPLENRMHFRGSSDPEEMARATWFTTIFKEAKDCPFKSSQDLILKLEALTGEVLDLAHWNKSFPENPDGSLIVPRPDLIDPSKPPIYNNLIQGTSSCRWNGAFNVKLQKHLLGEGVHDHDLDIWNSTGSNGWSGLVYLNKNAPRDSGLKLLRHRQGNDQERFSEAERWELMDDFANVYNRLILVRGWMPHAGGSGFGTSIQNGRLFQTFFFKTTPQELTPCMINL